MKRRRCTMILVWMFFLLFLLGIVSLPNEAIAQKKKVILIGGTISETGRYASDVKPWPKLMNTWAEMINERGGLWVKSEKRRIPVKFILYDDKSDQATSIKFYERLVTVDKVDLLIGPYTSPLTFAATTVAEKYKIPMVCVEGDSSLEIRAIIISDSKVVGVNRNSTTSGFPWFSQSRQSPTVESFSFASRNKDSCPYSLRHATICINEYGGSNEDRSVISHRSSLTTGIP